MQNIGNLTNNLELHSTFCETVLHRSWNTPPNFNTELSRLASAFVTKQKEERELAHILKKTIKSRLCFLHLNRDCEVIKTLLLMTKTTIQDFLLKTYNYEHTKEIFYSGSAHIHKKTGSRPNVWKHKHTDLDFVMAYYPEVDIAPEHAQDSSVNGSVRYYASPLNTLNSLNTKNISTVTPTAGSMILFEGSSCHEVTSFLGTKRVVITIKCKLESATNYQFSTISEY